MNAIKKLLGIVWIGLGLAAGYYLLINQAIIYTFVLAPIIVGGLGIFGYYSLTGEYGDK
jgi:hypothetical protein